MKQLFSMRMARARATDGDRRRALLVLLAVGCLAAVALSGCSGTMGANANGGKVTAPASIPTNCSRDVSGELQFWLDNTPNGGTFTLQPKACYLDNGGLNVVGRTQLTIDGNGATLRRTVTPTGFRLSC